MFDIDQKGKIFFGDLKRVIELVGNEVRFGCLVPLPSSFAFLAFAAVLTVVACSDADIADMIKEADKDGDNAINKDEFLRVMRFNVNCKYTDVHESDEEN